MSAHEPIRPKPYYAADDGSSCAPYLARGLALYWPAVDADLDATKPAVAAVVPPEVGR